MRWNVLLMLVAAVLGAPGEAEAAVGCTLNNPARDLKMFYPEMTSYREDVKEMPKFPDGKEMFAVLKARIGRDLAPVYETYNTPYSLYSVFKGEVRIGFVHGVNVPGIGGVIQGAIGVVQGAIGVVFLH